MPGGAGKPKRSCPTCKPHKFMGNSKTAIKHSIAKKLQDNGDDK